MVPTALPARMVHAASENWAEILFIGVVWFPFWTLAGIIVYRAWRWQLGGREVMVIHEGVLELRREWDRNRRAQTFDLWRVRNLRYAPELITQVPSMSINKSLRQLQVMFGAEGGSIAFDHDGRTHRFGIGLSETEARRLIATIRERFKILGDAWEPLPVES